MSVVLLRSTYTSPLAEVDAVRPAHSRFVAGLAREGLLVAAGRLDPPRGGILVLAVETCEEARALVADDPYVVHGVARYSATRWHLAHGQLAQQSR